MENIFVVTTVGTKGRCNTSTELDKVVFIDTDKNKIAHGLIGQANIKDFSIEERRYKGDFVNIEDSIGTLAFINKEHRFYGVFKYMGSTLYIEWITEDNLKRDKNYSSLSNLNGVLVDITSLGNRVFNHEWLSTVRKICVTGLNYKIQSKEKFIEILNKKEMDIIENNKEPEDTTLDKKDNTETVNGQNEYINDNSVENINKDILKQLVELELREKALIEKERIFQEKCIKIDRILSKLENVDVNKLIGTVVDADNIYKFDQVLKEKLNKSDIATEFTLKMLNSGDSICIDKNYFSKLYCLNKKSIEANVAYTYYKMIVALKFERESQYAMFGIVDYREDRDYIEFKVLKSYDNSGITEGEINKFYLEYLKNKNRSS